MTQSLRSQKSAKNLTRAVQLILIFTLLSYNSCLDEKQTIITPEVNNDKFYLDIDKNNKIYKVSYQSHLSSQNYNYEFIYYTDSIVKISSSAASADKYRTTYFLSDGRADSCIYYSGKIPQHYTKEYFLYDQDGYLIAKTEKIFMYNAVGLDDFFSYTTTYEYVNGNLTKMTFDPKRVSLAGKYITYSYHSLQNLTNIETFTGDWLGKQNKNLVRDKYTGDSMADTPPCSTYHYTIRSDGLVEKKTVSSCNNQNNYSLIITYEYNIIDL
jgi:hypothetical protein